MASPVVMSPGMSPIAATCCFPAPCHCARLLVQEDLVTGLTASSHVSHTTGLGQARRSSPPGQRAGCARS
jgi:hypothetical protein